MYELYYDARIHEYQVDVKCPEENGIFNGELARSFKSKRRLRSYRTIQLALKPIKIM